MTARPSWTLGRVVLVAVAALSSGLVAALALYLLYGGVGTVSGGVNLASPLLGGDPSSRKGRTLAGARSSPL